MMRRAVVFGASGHLGSAIASRLEEAGFSVVRAGRSSDSDVRTDDPEWVRHLAGGDPISAAVWAQGQNAIGSITDANGVGDLVALFDANVGYVARTARDLIASGLLAPRSRFVIVGSVWQDFARERKFAYVVSKSAVQGLVRSFAVDLGPLGISTNAVLPGVVDSPMSRAFLDVDQIRRVTAETPIGRLVTAADVAELACWLCVPESGAVNGQCISVDGGWSVSRRV